MEKAHIQDAVTEDKLSISELGLAVTGLIMLLAFFNALGGNDKKPFWKWGSSLTKKAQLTNPLSRKYVLITGCDRGLGYATAKSLDSYGYSVIAGFLDVKCDNVLKLQQETSTKLKAVQLDVTNIEDLDSVKLWMNENIEGELWGIVNNAGVCFVGTPEIMAQQDVNNVLAVNLIGTINVTKKFLPLIRRSKGRIVNLGSLNGEVPMPYFSIYNASKAAVKMLTETWSYELKPWDVKVSLVAPAAYQTGIIQYDRAACAKRWWNEASEEVQRDYGREYFNMGMRPSGRFKICEDVSPVTDSIIDALTSESPRAIYRAGRWSALLPSLCNFTPPSIKSFVCGKALNFIAGLPAALQTKDEK